MEVHNFSHKSFLLLFNKIQENKLWQLLQLPSVVVSLVFCDCTPVYSSMVKEIRPVGELIVKEHNQANWN